MNVLTTTWRQLVRRRLWPLAVLLVAALAAVPVLLSREPAPVAPPPDPVPAAEATKAGDEIAQPIVAMAEAGDRDRRRRVLGARKDPFEPAPAPKPKKKKSDTDEPQGDGASGVDGSGGTTAPVKPVDPGFVVPPTGGGTPVVPTTPVEPEPKPKTYPPDSLIVRFGDATSDTRERDNVRRLEALPSPDEPVLVYLRLSKDKKEAIFLVDSGVTPTGDGRCEPHPSSCEEIHLRKGETEFLDVVDPETGEVTAQYQLDLIDIKARRGKAKAAARSAQVAAGV